VLTQYKSHSLNRHITTTWRLSSLLDNYVTPVPAQQWLGPRWQAGSADAIYQSLTLIERDRPDLVLVAWAEALRKDAADEDSGHSMGGDIIPRLVRDGAAHVYDFPQNKVPGADARDQGYWREVGTIDSYFEAHMDLCAVHPVFNLYNHRWPILTTCPRSRRPSSCTRTGTGPGGRSTT
jgi:ADP-glucose pyrophosphorylase